MHYALRIRLHQRRLSVASPVQLEMYGVVGADGRAVEATHTARIVDVSFRDLYAFRGAHVFTLHATDAFVGIDRNMHQRLGVKASKRRAYRAHRSAEHLARFPCP